MFSYNSTLSSMLSARILALFLTVPAWGQSNPLKESFDLLERMEITTLDVFYEETTLREALADLSNRSGIACRSDWRVLDRLGVAPDDPITVPQTQISMTNLLSGIMLQLGDEFDRPTWEVHGGGVVITSPEATAPMALTDIYDIRSLLRDESTLQRLQNKPSSAPPPVPSPHDLPEESTPDDQDEDEENDSRSEEFIPLTPGEELMRLISYHIDPEAWVEYGGSHAKISEQNGLLFVTAPPRTHRRFREALQRLRQMNPTGVSVEAWIVDVPRTVVEQLSRRYGKSSRRFVLSILREKKTVEVWRADLVVALDQKGEVETKDDEAEIRLSLQPHQNAETGVLLMDIMVHTTDGEEQRRVETVASLPTPESTAILQLPPIWAEESEMLRLLLLLPEWH